MSDPAAWGIPGVETPGDNVTVTQPETPEPPDETPSHHDDWRHSVTRDPALVPSPEPSLGDIVRRLDAIGACLDTIINQNNWTANAVAQQQQIFAGIASVAGGMKGPMGGMVRNMLSGVTNGNGQQ